MKTQKMKVERLLFIFQISFMAIRWQISLHETCLTKLAQNSKQYWNNCLGWSSRHSCPPEIQLQSRRTGAVLMRRVKVFQETCFTKLAQNSKQYWNNCLGWSSRHSCPPEIQLLFGKIFLLKVIVMSFESCKIMQIMHKSINIVTGSENHEKLCVRHVGVHLNS